MVENRIGHNIQNYRLNRKLSIEYVSKKSGISTRKLHSLEKGRIIPTPDELIKLAKVFGPIQCMDFFYIDS